MRPKTKSIEEAAKLTRYRLDVKRSGGPLLPESFHASHAEAFSSGLLVLTGQTEQAAELPPGSDFAVRDGFKLGLG